MKTSTKILIAVSTLLAATGANAASSAATGVSQFNAGKVSAFAKQVEKTMAAKGARVFIIGRVGRPASELPRGFHFTHTAFAVYSLIQTADGRKVPGYVMYNLYQRDRQPEISDLVRDYPVDFFSAVYELKAGIIIPSPELQKRLLKVIASSTYKKLHNPRYSAIANPYTSKYQNCTEHTLDVINAAIYQTDNLAQLKANARAYFQAQPVRLNPLKLMMGSMFKADIAVSDHQDDEVRTATFSTIARYLKEHKLSQEEFVITPEGIR